MSDQITNDVQPQQDQPPIPQQGTEVTDVERLQAEVNKLRAEAAKTRVQRNEFRDALGQLGQALGLEPVQQPGQLEPFQKDLQQAIQQQIEQAVQSAVQPIQQQLQQETQQRAQAERAALEAQVRGEFQLPAYVRGLEGTTQDELRQDAEKLAAEIAASRPSQPISPIGATNPGQGAPSRELGERLYRQRRGGFDTALGLFSPESNEAMGGGVFFSDD